MEKTKSGMNRRRGLSKELMIPLIIFAAICVFIGVINPLFFTWQTWQNILMQVSNVGIIAFGATFVITSGGLDFTAGEGVSLACVVAATVFVSSNMSNTATILTGVAVGALIGAVNGLLITKLNIQPFIATLSMMTVIKGFLLFVAEGTIIHMDVEGSTFKQIGQGLIEFKWMGRNASGGVQGFPVAFITYVCVAVAVWLILNRTKFGQATLAMGGNEDAAKLAGVNVDFYRFWVYVFAGIMTGLGAMITLARVASIGVTLGGTNLLMDVVAAAVIGGTAVSGGRCNVFGTMLGTFIIISISSALVYLNIDSNWRNVVKGAIILVALVIDALAVRVGERMAIRRAAQLREETKKRKASQASV